MRWCEAVGVAKRAEQLICQWWLSGRHAARLCSFQVHAVCIVLTPLLLLCSLMFLLDECSKPKAAAVTAAGELPQQAVGQDGKGPSLGSTHERAGGVEAARFGKS